MYEASLGIFNVHVQQPPHTYHSPFACRISSKQDHQQQSYDVISIFKMAAAASQFYFRFGCREFDHLGRSNYTCIPNFGEISQSTAEVLLLPVSGNKRPHVRILFRSRFSRLRRHRHAILDLPPKFRTDGPTVNELWRYIQYLRWRPHHRNSTSGFVFGDSANFESPNLPADQILAINLNLR